MQALSNSEEERKGVAAALLAPLLPDVVKEEEERWRRKVICKEEVEAPLEEEVKVEEAPAAPEEPEPSRDPLEDTGQEDLCSVVQSGESAEEEEEEQDTIELEMVLERKKVRRNVCPRNGHTCSHGIAGNKLGCGVSAGRAACLGGRRWQRVGLQPALRWEPVGLAGHIPQAGLQEREMETVCGSCQPRVCQSRLQQNGPGEPRSRRSR